MREYSLSNGSIQYYQGKREKSVYRSYSGKLEQLVPAAQYPFTTSDIYVNSDDDSDGYADMSTKFSESHLPDRHVHELEDDTADDDQEFHLETVEDDGVGEKFIEEECEDGQVFDDEGYIRLA